MLAAPIFMEDGLVYTGSQEALMSLAWNGIGAAAIIGWNLVCGVAMFFTLKVSRPGPRPASDRCCSRCCGCSAWTRLTSCGGWTSSNTTSPHTLKVGPSGRGEPVAHATVQTWRSWRTSTCSPPSPWPSTGTRWSTTTPGGTQTTRTSSQEPTFPIIGDDNFNLYFNVGQCPLDNVC